MCVFFGEYFSAQGYQGGYTNNLIFNFKIKPTALLQKPARTQYKDGAIGEVAAALRRVIQPADVARITFVPIPSSKMVGHPDYCDRLHRTLTLAFGDQNPDIRLLLRQTQSVPADHESADRIDINALRAITEFDQTLVEPPPRRAIMLFDDVLTSGKHFRVAKERLLEAYPNASVIGLFVARRIPR